MFSPQLSKKIADYGLTEASISDLIKLALAEDLAGGSDVTSNATVTPEQISTAEFRNRKPGVISGLLVAVAVLEHCGINDYELLISEGDLAPANSALIRVKGNTRAILLSERTALNFLGKLSGISTLTKVWVSEVSEFKTKIRDTRKTTPGYRELEKFAVRMGGGTNHRMSLSDAALIKDNHVQAAGGAASAFNQVLTKNPTLPIEIEVDTIAQLNEILNLNVDLAMLDNMSPDQCRAAVALVAGKFKLEASGGITLENAKSYAATGVDYLAIGALTHSATNLDIGLDFLGDN
ncbi:MAG: carboxylating nicotinate-nucleotide diphosphorylase [Actinobacteria bacterium]|jgi:nicotinate-nucleotide pyrophosphorylase (carboxylating)|nr:carboxylating nicotinate-nucleotide diphosphorylase [Actinomycetota bacterium]NDH12729.1 carboxylating nicotinate-nucleotide diphosphorylase [Actinomycetota bacterium]